MSFCAASDRSSAGDVDAGDLAERIGERIGDGCGSTVRVDGRVDTETRGTDPQPITSDRSRRRPPAGVRPAAAWAPMFVVDVDFFIARISNCGEVFPDEPTIDDPHTVRVPRDVGVFPDPAASSSSRRPRVAP